MGVKGITKYTGLGADCTEKQSICYNSTSASFAYYTLKDKAMPERTKGPTERTDLDLVNDTNPTQYLQVADKCSAHSLYGLNHIL